MDYEKDDMCLQSIKGDIHNLNTGIQIMQNDIRSIKDMVKKNIEDNDESLKKHSESIAGLKEEVAEMRGRSLGSNNLGQIVLSGALIIITLLTIFFK